MPQPTDANNKFSLYIARSNNLLARIQAPIGKANIVGLVLGVRGTQFHGVGKRSRMA